MIKSSIKTIACSPIEHNTILFVAATSIQFSNRIEVEFIAFL